MQAHRHDPRWRAWTTMALSRVAARTDVLALVALTVAYWAATEAGKWWFYRRQAPAFARV